MCEALNRQKFRQYGNFISAKYRANIYLKLTEGRSTFELSKNNHPQGCK